MLRFSVINFFVICDSEGTMNTKNPLKRKIVLFNQMLFDGINL